MELDACSGGCVGGVLTVENPYVAEVKLKHLRKYMPVARSHMDAETEEKAEGLLPWTENVEYEPVYNLGESMMESFARLSRIEALSKQLPGLDCGACGAPSCRALAEDIARGEAKEEDCVYVMKERMQKLLEKQKREKSENADENTGENTV